MPISVYFQDARPEIRQAIFLRFIVSQCCDAPETSDARALSVLRNLKQSLHHEINSQGVDLDGNTLPLTDPPKILRKFIGHYQLAISDQPKSILGNIRPSMRRLARRMQAFRRGEHIFTGRDWQSSEEPNLPDPNPTLEVYRGEMVPFIEAIQVAYERALDAPIDLHVNIALTPKSSKSGATNGVTENRKVGSSNPSPVGRTVTRVVRVEVRLPSEITGDAAFMIPYTISHEVGVHAFQQFGLPDAPYAEECKWLFSEGFMDAVITELLSDQLSALQNGHPFNIKRLQAARFRHQSRLVDELPSAATKRRDLWNEQIIKGQRAWKHLLDIAAIAGTDELGASPKEWATDVSLKLNTLPLSTDVRDSFLSGFLASFGYFQTEVPTLPAPGEFRSVTDSHELASTRQHPFDYYWQIFKDIYDLDDSAHLASAVLQLVDELPECNPDFPYL